MTSLVLNNRAQNSKFWSHFQLVIGDKYLQVDLRDAHPGTWLFHATLSVQERVVVAPAVSVKP